VIENIRAGKSKMFGYDGSNDVYTDLLKAGVIAPAKVTHKVLENAASIAALVLPKEVRLTEIPEAPSAIPAPAPMDD
jgi:chaperonin GroEL